MTRFASLNQFVNLWECDENDHMNVQFYYSKFDDAGRLFAICNDLESVMGSRISRHVRYHSELRGGAQVRILSSLVTSSSETASILGSTEIGFLVQHVMEETTTGKIAATALDCYTGFVDDPDDAIQDALSLAAMPRGLKKAPDFSSKTPIPALDHTVSRGVLHPALCNAQGEALDQAYIGAVSDAAAHAWDKIGLNGRWLEEHGFGRIAVEMRLCIHQPMVQGTAYQMQLALTGLQTRSYTKRYDFFDLRGGHHIGFLDSAVMLLNHNTRKSEPLPDFAREAILAEIGGNAD